MGIALGLVLVLGLVETDITRGGVTGPMTSSWTHVTSVMTRPAGGLAGRAVGDS